MEREKRERMSECVCVCVRGRIARTNILIIIYFDIYMYIERN